MTLRWVLFFASIVFLFWAIFVSLSRLSVAGFVICGVAWYWLGRRKALELDAPRPR